MANTTILKIVTLCVICAAMTMSGCVSDDAASTSPVPFTFTSIIEDPSGESDYTYSIHYIVKEGGAGEGRVIGLGDDINVPLTWKAGSSANEFVIIGIDGSEGLLTLSDDGAAIMRTGTEDDDLEGTWSRN